MLRVKNPEPQASGIHLHRRCAENHAVIRGGRELGGGFPFAARLNIDLADAPPRISVGDETGIPGAVAANAQPNLERLAE